MLAFSRSSRRSSRYWYLNFFRALHSLADCLDLSSFDWKITWNHYQLKLVSLAKQRSTFMSDLRDFWLGFRPLLDFVPTDDESCSMGDTPYESNREIKIRKYFTWKQNKKLTSQWRWYLAACALGPVRTVLDWWLVNQLRELILLKLTLAKVEFLVRFL